jgi:hypothetical protein
MENKTGGIHPASFYFKYATQIRWLLVAGDSAQFLFVCKTSQ